MTTYTELLPETKSEKAGVLTWDATARVLAIAGKRDHCRYAVTEFAADMPGRAFALVKVDAGADKTEERYSCLLAANGMSRCECRGFYYTARSGAGRCKHLAALAELVAAGQV